MGADYYLFFFDETSNLARVKKRGAGRQDAIAGVMCEVDGKHRQWRRLVTPR